VWWEGGLAWIIPEPHCAVSEGWEDIGGELPDFMFGLPRQEAWLMKKPPTLQINEAYIRKLLDPETKRKIGLICACLGTKEYRDGYGELVKGLELVRWGISGPLMSEVALVLDVI